MQMQKNLRLSLNFSFQDMEARGRKSELSKTINGSVFEANMCSQNNKEDG